MTKYILLSWVLIVGMAGVMSCEAPCTQSVSQAEINGVDQTQLQQDIAAIDAYLAANNITAVTDASGLRYKINKQGGGARPCLENRVTVTYMGRLMSTGASFDGTSNPVSFPLNNLILGWKIGLTKIQAGTNITLYVPSGFAYGSNGTAGIPPNANLIFDIELIQ